jgi:hypothetical protein
MGAQVVEAMTLDLDPGGIAEMSDAYLLEPERPQDRLGPFDPPEHRHADLGAIRDPTRQTGRRWFVPGPQAESTGGGTHIGFGESGIDEGKLGASLGGGALAGSMIAEIVEVDAEHDRRWRGTGLRLLFGVDGGDDRIEGIHQGAFAVITAIRIVVPVGGIVHLVGDDRLPVETPFGSQAGAVVGLGISQGRRDRRDASAPLGTEAAMGHGGEKRRVGTPAEGDHDSAEGVEVFAERSQFRVERIDIHTIILPDLSG